ncbi:tektin-2 [Chanos chanos]|uniref:Tektin n=1 Tax=Chanos chanos TaxID=29144 RepID=A0A6J2WIG2_CHACN|nr:tektin-2 [Chanos chanos]
MATMSVKPALRYSVSDWENNIQELAGRAEHIRQLSHEIRQAGTTLRNEAASKTNWDENASCRTLSDRIRDVTRWKENLEACAQEVDTEMDALTRSKEETERALSAMTLPLEVTVECLTLREGRQGNELVSDPVEADLKKEVEVIDRVQRTLQQCIDQAFEQLCLLQEARHQLTLDLQNKMEALDVDTSCLSLTVDSPEISLKPNPTRVPHGSTTPQQWEQFSHHNVTQALEGIQASVQLRENMSMTRVQVQIELEAQRLATEFSLRKRTHQLEQACHELQWQLKTAQDEISDLESDIRGLEEELHAKMGPLKLVHTRLENRTKRPGIDMCRDEVQYGLVEEAKQLDATILALKNKLSQAQHSLQSLRQHEARMAEDLSRKKDALSLECRSRETRQRLTVAVQAESSQSIVVPLTNSSGRHTLQLA